MGRNGNGLTKAASVVTSCCLGWGALTVMDTPGSAQRPYAFVVGSGGRLLVNWWDGSRWNWADQGFPGGAGGKTVAARVGVLTVTDSGSSAQRPYAFVEAHDQNAPLGNNSVAVNWWDGSQWNWAD